MSLHGFISNFFDLYCNWYWLNLTCSSWTISQLSAAQFPRFTSFARDDSFVTFSTSWKSDEKSPSKQYFVELHTKDLYTNTSPPKFFGARSMCGCYFLTVMLCLHYDIQCFGGWVNSNESKKYSFFIEIFGSKRFNFIALYHQTADDKKQKAVGNTNARIVRVIE